MRSVGGPSLQDQFAGPVILPTPGHAGVVVPVLLHAGEHPVDQSFGLWSRHRQDEGQGQDADQGLLISTVINAPSGRGRCSSRASSQGARIQTSRSTAVVRMTGIAFG